MMTPATTTTHAYLRRAAAPTPTVFGRTAFGRTAVPTAKTASNSNINGKSACGHARAVGTTMATAKKATATATTVTKPAVATATTGAAASPKPAGDQICQLMMDFFGKSDLSRLYSREKRLVAALQRVVKSVEDERDAFRHALDEMRSDTEKMHSELETMRSEMECERQRRASFASAASTTSTCTIDSTTTSITSATMSLTGETNTTDHAILTTPAVEIPPTSDTLATPMATCGTATDACESAEMARAQDESDADAAATVHGHDDADGNDAVGCEDDEDEKCDDSSDANAVDDENNDDEEDEEDEDAMWAAREAELDFLYPCAAQSRANVARFVDQYQQLYTPHHDEVATVTIAVTAIDDVALAAVPGQSYSFTTLEAEPVGECDNTDGSVSASNARADNDTDIGTDGSDGEADHESDDEEDHDASVWNAVTYDDLDLETIQPPKLRRDIARMLAKANAATNHDGQHLPNAQGLKAHDVAILMPAHAARQRMTENDDDDTIRLLVTSQAADPSDSYSDSDVDSYSISDVGGEDDLVWHLLDQETLCADIGNGCDDSMDSSSYSFSICYAYNDSDSDSDNYEDDADVDVDVDVDVDDGDSLIWNLLDKEALLVNSPTHASSPRCHDCSLDDFSFDVDDEDFDCNGYDGLHHPQHQWV